MIRIHRLPLDVQNRIAAGEVVERPASVVKELVENSVDAGASRIRIDLTAAGRRMIAIADDGTGMSPEDARLSLERFATSKISNSDDLFGVSTLGFRGEALAAISAVSRFTLITAERGATAGIRISVDGGTISDERPAPPSAGTVIEVRDLFFNTPARLKFMKSEPTELWRAAEAVTERALANPNIAFKLVNNSSALFDLPAAASLNDRIIDLFGGEFADSLKPVEYAGAGVSIRGVVSMREHHATRRQQYLFVNGRPVRNAAATQPVYRAMRGRIPDGRHPVFILFVEVPGDQVDVNVHPTKQEVRFARPDVVVQAMHRCFGGEFTSSAKADETDPFHKSYPSHYSHQTEQPAHVAETTTLFGASSGLLAEEFDTLPPARRFMRLGGPFIAFPEEGGITIVDFHAAHERVLYEKLMSRSPVSVPFLIPLTVELPRAAAGILAENLDLLAGFAMEAEPFGPHSFVVRAAPPELKREQTQALLNDLAGLLAGFTADADAGGGNGLRSEAAARIACHEAFRSGDAISDNDIEGLLSRLAPCERPDICPHGRPTTIRLSGKDLFRMFKRA
ncbi:MAG: DNA mismatch repair endonuclease MutL [Nitrospirae bacterium]|nr:DNA mismatch repair endonuclease MutL [Nitrospirota bacterium]